MQHEALQPACPGLQQGGGAAGGRSEVGPDPGPGPRPMPACLQLAPARLILSR